MNNIDTTKPSIIPLLDNEEAREKVTDELNKSESVSTFLNRVADDFVARDKFPERTRSKEKAERIRYYFMSEHNGKIVDGEYEDLSDVGDPYFYTPTMNTNKDSILPHLLQSFAVLQAKPRYDDSIKNKRLAEFLTKDFMNWLQRPEYLDKKQREIEWNLLAAGDSYRYTYLNTNKTAAIIKKPVGQKEELTTRKKGKWSCPVCKASGYLSDLDMAADVQDLGDIDTPNQGEQAKICPQCDYRAVKVMPDVSFEITLHQETEDVSLPDVDYDVPDANEITVIWTSDNIAEALAVIWTRDIPHCVLQRQFPDVVIPHSKTANAADGSRSPNSSADVDTGDVTFQRIWLNADVYHAHRVERDETFLLDGKEMSLPGGADVLPKGFKRGLFYARADKKIVQMYEQAIGDCWTHCVNQTGRLGYGVGEFDLLELQFQENEMRTNEMNSALSDDNQPLMYDINAYPAGDFPNSPGSVVGIDLPSGKSLNDVAKRVEAGKPPTMAMTLSERIKGDAQSRQGAMSTGTGSQPDMKAISGTATGYMAYQNHTIERRRPLLQRIAVNLDLQQFYQYWEIKKAYWSQAAFEQYYSSVPKEIIEWLMECDIRQEFDVSIVANSFMPETREQKQIKFNNWLLTPSAQADMADPIKAKEIARYTSELFDAPDFAERSEEQTEAQLRLDKIINSAQAVERDQLKSGVGIKDVNGFIYPQLIKTALEQSTKVCKMLSSPADPFAGIPIDILLDDHDEFIDVYQDHLRSSEGRNLSQFIRTCIRQLIVIHSQGAAMKQQYVDALFMEVQAQQLAFQREQQQADMMAQAETQMMLAEGQREQQLAAEEEDFTRQMVAGEAQHEQEFAQEDEKQAQKLQYKAINQVMDEEKQNNGSN